MRQARGELRTFALDVERTAFAPPQPDGWAHLCTVMSGSMRLCSGDRSWIVADASGVWIPAGKPYLLETQSACRIRILYVPVADGRPEDVMGVEVGPLLRVLIDTASSFGYLDRSQPYHDKIGSLIDEELHRLAPTRMPMALSEICARDAMTAVMHDLESPPRITTIARTLAISPRTFERRFARETGVSPRRWLRRAKVAAARLALDGGANVTEAGLASGYTSTSAFISAFRAETGETPGAYRTRQRLRI